MVHSNNRPPAPMISGKLPLQTWISVAIFDLCFEEISDASSCGLAAALSSWHSSVAGVLISVSPELEKGTG